MGIVVATISVCLLVFFSLIYIDKYAVISIAAVVVKHPTKPIISFCNGALFACAVFDNNKMKCFGQMYPLGLALSGVIGDVASELGDNLPYMNVGTNAKIVEVACGSIHLCVKLDTGDVKCLGKNTEGQVGIEVTDDVVGEITGYSGDALPAVDFGAGLQVLDMTLGNGFGCFIVTGNKVKCMGDGDVGQLGYENSTDRGRGPTDMGIDLPFVDLGTGVEAASIHSSNLSKHVCIILSKPVADAQKSKCWGFNQFYQLGIISDDRNRGDGPNEMGNNLPLLNFGTESRVKQFFFGERHTCAILQNDALKCFGSGDLGQIASGEIRIVELAGDSLPATTIDAGKTIKFVSSSQFHNCIVYDDLITMKCFGFNNNGQLGQGDIVNRGDTPTSLIPLIPNIDLGTGTLKISSIHSGVYLNCVVFEDNSVKCFGYNSEGELGIGKTGNIGDGPGEMGNNLEYVVLFSPTVSPTKAPSKTPTVAPTPPTNIPTFSPTKPCDYQSAKICKYDFKCMWRKLNGTKKCVVFDCAALNKNKCGKERKRCTWNKIASTCNPK